MKQKRKIMLIQNDKKEMGNNEMSKFHSNYTPNKVVMQNSENIEKLNYQEEMPNNPTSTFYMNNENDRQGQIKNIINYMNKMLQEQNMSHQIQMNKNAARTEYEPSNSNEQKCCKNRI